MYCSLSPVDTRVGVVVRERQPVGHAVVGGAAALRWRARGRTGPRWPRRRSRRRCRWGRSSGWPTGPRSNRARPGLELDQDDQLLVLARAAERRLGLGHLGRLRRLQPLGGGRGGTLTGDDVRGLESSGGVEPRGVPVVAVAALDHAVVALDGRDAVGDEGAEPVHLDLGAVRLGHGERRRVDRRTAVAGLDGGLLAAGAASVEVDISARPAQARAVAPTAATATFRRCPVDVLGRDMSRTLSHAVNPGLTRMDQGRVATERRQTGRTGSTPSDPPRRPRPRRSRRRPAATSRRRGRPR